VGVRLPGVVGVEGVAEAIAERVQREDGQEQCRPWVDDEVWSCAQVLEPVDEKSTPARSRRLRAETDKAEKGFGKDRL
jgi:hypothetical protein